MNCWITELYVKEISMSERRVINILELASTLADKELHQTVLDAVTNRDKTNLCPNGIMQEVHTGDSVTETYTEEAQEIFNELYDKYTEIIENCSK